MCNDYGIHNLEQISKLCYYAGLGIGFIGLTCMILISAFNISISEIIPECVFHAATGYYCPGCGGTRAVIALLHGDLLTSWYYHPFVIYMTIYYFLYEISNSFSIVTRGRVRGLRFCPLVFYIGIVIIIAQWLIKNYLRFRYGFTL